MPADETAEFDMIERHLDMLEELTAGIGYFDPGMMPVEEVDAEKFLELPHALTDAGLANAKRSAPRRKLRCSATFMA